MLAVRPLIRGLLFILLIALYLIFSAVWIWGMVRAHDGYSSWQNKNNVSCCNNLDCAPIDDENVTEVGHDIAVRIFGSWCLVRPHHYLSTGNAPDWSTAHVCVARTAVPICERLLCFQPKPRM
jgi:hypothetical protein